MYTDPKMLESIKKVEASRPERMGLDLTKIRMTPEEKTTLLETYHPDYRKDQFSVLEIGPNKGEKVPTQLAELLQANSRIEGRHIDL